MSRFRPTLKGSLLGAGVDRHGPLGLVVIDVGVSAQSYRTLHGGTGLVELVGVKKPIIDQVYFVFNFKGIGLGLLASVGQGDFVVVGFFLHVPKGVVKLEGVGTARGYAGRTRSAAVVHRYANRDAFAGVIGYIQVYSGAQGQGRACV